MYLKLTNNSCRLHSPSKIAGDKCTFPYGGSLHLQKNNVRLLIQYAEKMSTRLDQLKKKDPMLEIDLVDIFMSNMQLVK